VESDRRQPIAPIITFKRHYPVVSLVEPRLGVRDAPFDGLSARVESANGAIRSAIAPYEPPRPSRSLVAITEMVRW
jgi:hypothetical protein